MIDLRLLRNFEAVYRLSSFSRAADELGMTQSALTKSIKALESSWQTQLFQRTTRSVTPTAAGRRLHPLALDLLGFAATVRRETQGAARTLRIVAGQAVLETLIAPILLAFRERFPEVRVVAEALAPALALEEIVQRRAHLMLYHSATVAALAHQTRFRVEEVHREPYAIVHRAGHPHALPGSPIADLLALDWAVVAYDALFESGLPAPTRDALLNAGFPRYRLFSQAACLELATRSDVITIAPQSFLAARALGDGLAVRPLADDFEFAVSAVALAGADPDPALQCLIECARFAGPR